MQAWKNPDAKGAVQKNLPPTRFISQKPGTTVISECEPKKAMLSS
jgi:hypothetical protein